MGAGVEEGAMRASAPWASPTGASTMGVSTTGASATGTSATGISATGVSATEVSVIGASVAPALGLLEQGIRASDFIWDSQQDSLGATWGHLGKGALVRCRHSGEPLAPLWFQSFRLYTVWSRLPGGEPVHQIAFPHLRGDATAPMLEYEPEKIPQSMWQGPRMLISLRPPSKEHWNIESDLMLTLTMEMYKQRHEAKRVEQDPERESTGTKASPKEMPVLEEAPQAVASGSKAASPTETTCQGERDLETALGVIECIHALRLQIIHEMGSVREVEQVAVHTLMAEFARLQSILCEDLTKSLSALCSELEPSSEVLLADILNTLNLHPGDPGFSRVRELMQKHHQSVSMKVNLPLIELEAAKEDLERFLQERLNEMGFNPKAWEVLEEISWILSSHSRKVRETILILGIEQPGVFNRIVLALSMDQPMEAVLLPGILDRLSGRLGFMPPGVVDPPTSAREGIS